MANINQKLNEFSSFIIDSTVNALASACVDMKLTNTQADKITNIARQSAQAASTSVNERFAAVILTEATHSLTLKKK
jgi:hypothetical protein